MRLMIAIPALEMMHSKFVECLVRLTARLDEAGISNTVEITGRTQVHKARAQLLKTATEGGYTHVLWLDSDMVFEPDIAERLLKHNKDFVTGIYHARRPPFRSVIFSNMMTSPLERLDPGEDTASPAEIMACGFGCVLTSVDMLRTVERYYPRPFTPSGQSGEDIMFCERARQAGYKIWCDTTIRCGHIATTVVWPDKAAALNEALK